MKRRDFAIGLFLAAATRSARAREPARQHRIAIVIPAGPVATIGEEDRLWRTFFEELHRLGDVEAENLAVERYSAEGRPEGYADLAREVVSRDPDVIVAAGNAFARAARAATGTIPIVWIGGSLIRAGMVPSLARPGGNITGVTSDAGIEISGKRLQILKEAVPAASRVAYLWIEQEWEGAGGQQVAGFDQEQLREASRRLEITLIDMAVQEATPSALQRVLTEITRARPDAIILGPMGEFIAHRQLIVDIVEKSRLPQKNHRSVERDRRAL
jgi:putative ABC transport system substrate-binding protein